MSILTRSKFKGIKLDKINHYIRLINENLNAKLYESEYWQGAVSNLINFLNKNHFTQYEGINITDKAISSLISRLNKKKVLKSIDKKEELKSIDKNNFLLSKKIMSNKRPVIPELINDIDELNKMRVKSYNGLHDEGYGQKDLSQALDEMTMYRQKMANIRPYKKNKKNKYGNIGMDELVNIVTKLKQDIKQIKDTQSVVSANDWINRHGLKDLYEAKGRDLDGDGIPEVVVQTKDALQKPVIVNGYTTVPSLFPYRNAFYSKYPSYEQRKEAHKKGINLRTMINDIYQPEYDELGMNVDGYSGENWQDFERKLSEYGIDEKRFIKPKKRSTYQAFVARCISPIYQAVKYINVRKLPFTLTEMASVIWNQFALLPAMVYVYGENVIHVDDEQWKNLRGKKAVKNAISYIVNDYLKNPIKIGEFVPTVCEMCNLKGMPVEKGDIPLVAKVTVAIIGIGIDALPTDPSKFTEWFDKYAQSNPQALPNSPIVDEPEE